MENNARVMIVEDERIVALDIERQLQTLGYNVIANVDSGEEAITSALQYAPNLILMDIHLAGELDGVTTASLIQQHIDVPVLYATAYTDEETLSRAKVSQPYGYIIKPIDSRELQISMAIALQLHQSHLRLTAAEQKMQRQSEELKEALRAVHKLEEMKGQFVRNASHELRTPLALVLGYAEMLVGGDFGGLTPGQQTAMEVISRRANELRMMIEDMSLLLESSDENVAIKHDPVELSLILERVTADWQGKAELSGLTFESSVDKILPSVLASPVQLHRIFAHLLSNAVKFTPVGGKVSLSTNYDEKHVRVTVKDTGVGIPKEEHRTIFRRFYQVDGSSKRKYPGMGLGLAVVKEAVESMEGEVLVESEVGRGSSFTVALPIHQVNTKHLQSALVIDDIGHVNPSLEQDWTMQRMITGWSSED